MLTAIVITLLALGILMDMAPSFKDWVLKEKMVYISILSLGFFALILFSLDIRVPGPSEAIMKVVFDMFPKIK